MEVITVPAGPMEANCYILADYDNGQCLVIDPGDDAPVIEGLIRSLGLKVAGILLTHAHFDHIGAAQQISDAFGAKIWVHPAEDSFLKDGMKNSSALFDPSHSVTVSASTEAVKQGVQKIGDFTVDAIYAPGHSIGSTVYQIGQNLFTGDVLFQGSIGRTDLPSGNADEMRQSLNLLKNLPGDYAVYPGHGPATTLQWERTHNPYLLYNLI